MIRTEKNNISIFLYKLEIIKDEVEDLFKILNRFGKLNIYRREIEEDFLLFHEMIDSFIFHGETYEWKMSEIERIGRKWLSIFQENLDSFKSKINEKEKLFILPRIETHLETLKMVL